MPKKKYIRERFIEGVFITVQLKPIGYLIKKSYDPKIYPNKKPQLDYKDNLTAAIGKYDEWVSDVENEIL